MRLGTYNDWKNVQPQHSFGEARPHLIWQTASAGLLAILFFALAFRGRWIVLYLLAFTFFGSLFGLAAFLLLVRALFAFQRFNWVVRIVPRGLLLQFRPVIRRARIGDTPSIVLIDREEIRSIAKRVERRYTATSNSDNTEWISESFLEIRLSHRNTEGLAQAIRNEQLASPDDLPMWLAGADTIRVHFEGPRIRPKLDAAIRVLGRYFPVDAPSYSELKDWRTLTTDEAQSYANLMSDRGHEHEAFVVLNERCSNTGINAGAYLTGRRRELAGLCPDCGYDLRATPERCPECGRLVGSR